MADSHGGPRKGKKQGIKRVKSGCGTCKARKVKCDEKRPVCDRCISTGRTCEGYGVWGSGGNYYGTRQPFTSKKSLPASTNFDSRCKHLFLPDMDSIKFLRSKATKDESSCFEFYYLRTMLKIPGFFNSGFWDRIVLQISSTEPAVFHATIALAATQRSQELHSSMRNEWDVKFLDCDSEMDKWDRFALMNYNKAISQLQDHFRSRNHQSVQIALTTCILFTCIELMRGTYSAANIHIDHGIKVLQNLKQRRTDNDPSLSNTVLRTPNLTTVDDHLLETLARMNIQSVLFGYPSRFLHITGRDARQRQRYEPPNLFVTLEEARQHLEVLLNDIINLTEESHMSDLSSDRIASLLDQRNELQQGLDSWGEVYRRAIAMLLPTLDVRRGMGLAILRVYYIMAQIMVDTVPLFDGSWSEMVYDKYHDHFVELIDKVADLVFMRNLPVRYDFDLKGCRLGPLNFCADIGLIAPLYYTALKCRMPSLRREAVRMLIVAPHREVVWDGSAVAAAAKKVIELEEGDFYLTNSPPSTTFQASSGFSHAEKRPLPESYRFQRVQVSLEDGLNGNGKVICWRPRRGDVDVFVSSLDNGQEDWDVIEEDFQYQRAFTRTLP
ncbi:Autophagy-related protein 2 [Talaromyces islandicus]|uniref:Autophagy-related protein 2 n=1 Tax=Talaromyces islandicus TaxID=28573 RepID=A0A0U1M385_TALIS|nr:Autophagy-related protein 2 [Talaromyces islandicus]